MKRRPRVSCEWSDAFAYSIGIIATDGNLSSDGRHINVTSKDLDLLEILKSIWNIDNKISMKARGGSKDKKYGVLQFGDIQFYEFLLSIGLTPRKSKTLRPLSIPEKYFPAFIRGCVDGDGCITAYTHPESKLPQVRVSICSASRPFLVWLHASVRKQMGIQGGWISASDRRGTSSLVFGKKDSIQLLQKMYENKDRYFLARKYRTAKTYMFGRVAELV